MKHSQPREVADLKGSAKRHPERYRGEPPKSGLPIGNPPKLRAGGKAAWVEISAYAPPGVLTGGDRIMLEVASNLLAVYREDVDEMPANKLKELIGLLARFGMSSADRGKLNIEKPPVENPFNNLDS